jgi:transposase-like protein
MVRTHPSTPDERAQLAVAMLAHRGEYGIITRLSRTSGVSRPTLYAWRSQAECALKQAFTPPCSAPVITPQLSRQVLTVWIAHSSDRDIQSCFRTLTAQGISLTTITTILQEAEQRALQWLATTAPPSVRALALDEIYAKARRGAYLNAVDVHSGAVWASVGPVAVDTDSWTLVLWELQAREVVWDRLTMDGGAAARAASHTVTPDLLIQGDQWHVLHSCAQCQGRLLRWLQDLQQQTTVVVRQAARITAGQKPRCRNPKTEVVVHTADVAAAQRLVDAIGFLTQELRRLLDVVVLDGRGVLSAAQRQQELSSLLSLWAEVVAAAPKPQQAMLRELLSTVTEALPELLTFVAHLDWVQADLRSVLAPERQALLGWAWLRRKTLGWSAGDILAAIPPTWRDAARLLLLAWADAVRVSTAVERWHSILRVHLTVHRTLSPGRLALLAVWHNHRLFTRGIHKGNNPLHLSGMRDAPTDWLVALGYPPADASSITDARPTLAPAIACAA